MLRAAAAAALAVVVIAGCSVVLDPERYDDVPRCKYDDDCPDYDDPRFEFQCVVAEGLEDDNSFPHVCAPRAAASCAPDDYDYYGAFPTRHREAKAVEARYEDRCEELGGVRGCAPGPNGCLNGLKRHKKSGRCDDTDPTTPPALAPLPIVSGQDVLDQFCRALYCSMDFVCDTTDYRCVPCELGASLGQGGCGELYIDGQRSSVYLDQPELDDACEGAKMSEDDVVLGPVDESV